MASGPIVRFADFQDVPTILSFIKAGAVEQHPGACVEATEAALVKALHLNRAPSDARAGSDIDHHPQFAWALLIVAPNGEIAGLAIYFYNYSTWRAAPGVCLEELYVEPQYRSKGYAQLLIKVMAREAAKMGCVKMEWVCLKSNERALRFYQKIGARVMGDWVVLRVDESGIQDLQEQL
ncbi:N-acetyltransferase ats1 [Xylaria bambusicola]|uniref:N-acetyltransferase ats1 n=1 Tax=Xylaria bambusicola TaxID=326684 RepID=UPI00200781FD|nr:N-acetyltransferase ats1 [Xylaria bambusicola]KAI0521003.1 N-acetyltransferase ats1 [Xylaria bambusicola]